MQREQFDVDNLFCEAIVIDDATARLTFIKEASGENTQLSQQLEKLVAAHFRAGEFLQEPLGEREAKYALSDDPDGPQAYAQELGSAIGPYRIRELLGEGGMGRVYLAEQELPIRRTVALKVINPGMDSRDVVARFDAERQVLSLMDHPNIARSIDGGATSTGRPYFVMELVRGLPITEYCDDRRLGMPERLRLFSKVCRALQHAHQKAVIHRDLKPSNILVAEIDGEAVPKVIDFGIAKAVGQKLSQETICTHFAQIVGTPLYMSPEQAEMGVTDVDTRSDVYSLGALLYELLAGATPFDSARLKELSFDEMRRIIREVDPARPSAQVDAMKAVNISTVAQRRQLDPRQIKRLLRGELDWIVMKAMAKDRNRRYQSAGGLGEDLERYLAGEPIQAAPPSRVYAIKKFAGRNRGPVIAGTLLLLTLSAGMVGTSFGLWQARRATEAERQSKAEANSQRVRAEQRESEAVDAVRRFGDVVANNEDLKHSPELESLRASLLEEPLKYFKSLRDRLKSNADIHPKSLSRIADAAYDLGDLTLEIGNNQEALQAFEEARDIRERLVLEFPQDLENQRKLAYTYRTIAGQLRISGKKSESLAASDQARVIQERLLKQSPADKQLRSDYSTTQQEMGLAYHVTGELDKALAANEQARAIQEQLVREDKTDARMQAALAGTLHNLANVLLSIGRRDDALIVFDQALAMMEHLAQEEPLYRFQLSVLTVSHGDALRATGKPADAKNSYERARDIQAELVREKQNARHFQGALVTTLCNLADLSFERGDAADAQVALEEARLMQERLADADPDNMTEQHRLALLLHNLSALNYNAKRFTAALELITLAIEHDKRALSQQPKDSSWRENLQRHYEQLWSVAGALNDSRLKGEVIRERAEFFASAPEGVSLDQRLAAVMGGATPTSAEELDSLVQRSYVTGRFNLCLDLCRQGIERGADTHFDAACCALLVAGGLSLDGEQIDDTTRGQLHAQALTWLQAELDKLTEQLATATSEDQKHVADALAWWRTDYDLAEVRDLDNLDALTDDERRDWTSFWARVDELHVRATNSPGHNHP